jgi:diguanylate cyclase (GGDEF)-like protein
VRVSNSGLEAQQLVELLAVVSSCNDEDTAIRAAVERAAETVEAELCAVVRGGVVVAAVGLSRATSDYGRLVDVPAGRRTALELSGLGMCTVGAAALGGGDEGRLVLGRVGEEFSVAEYNLIRGMARVLGLTLRMLATLDAERRRQRLMQHLYQVQRAISRRAPMPQVLQMTIDGALDVLAGDHGRAELWLAEKGGFGQVTLACTAGGSDPDPARPGDRRRPVREEWPIGAAMLADDVRCAGGTVAAPVHEHGRIAGAISVTRPAGPAFTVSEHEKLLSFAEHASLALSDAKTLREINEAMHDSLTGLPGRALFLRGLRELLAGDGTGRIALLFIDLDLFKEVNDTFGHAAGDALLAEFANRLRRAVRGHDLAGRLGGDEFAVAVRTESESAAVELAARVLTEVVQPFAVPGGTARIGASVGIALADGSGHDEPALIRHADAAMYQAKQNGRGSVVVYRPPAQTGPADVDGWHPVDGLLPA